MLNQNKIPNALKALRQWVNWKTVIRSGKATKVPFQPDGKPASSTGPETWSSLALVIAASSDTLGIGYVFAKSDPFCGIDLDGCRDPKTGAVAEWAKQIIKTLDSYCEVSPSQTGVKIWICGKLPFESGKKRAVAVERVCDKEPAIEVYDWGRYFAVTGQRLAGVPAEPQERQEQLDELCKTHFAETEGVRQERECSRLSVIERARKYLDTIPGAVAGQGGHNSTFTAACVLILGFGLTKPESMVLMSEYNARCQPPWSEKELRHKLDSADKQPGERGYLANKNDQQVKSIKLPEYHEPREVDASAPRITTLQAAAQNYLSALDAGHAQLTDLGIADVDAAIGGGVHPGEMVIVAARPSHGKTAFALQALDCAALAGMPTAMVSEEMSALALGKRTIQFASETPEEHWRTGMKAMHVDMAKHFADRAPCYVVEGCGTIDRVENEVRRLVQERAVRVVAVDYAQLLESRGKDQYQKVTATSKALRKLANETKVVLIVLAQARRAIETRKVFIPQLSDLKESGQLEQDADVTLFLVWPHRINSSKPPNMFEVHVLKNRNRPINSTCVTCEFQPSRQRIVIPSASQRVRSMKNYEPAFEQPELLPDDPIADFLNS